MKTVVICAAIFLSGASLSLLALGDAEDESSCGFCPAPENQTSKNLAESKGTALNKVAQTAEKPKEQSYSCLLSPEELEERRTKTNTEILAKADQIVETKDGYKLKFPEADDELVTTLVEWINVERKCCSFLRFELAFEQFSGAVWLEVGGDAGAKQLLKNVMER